MEAKTTMNPIKLQELCVSSHTVQILERLMEEHGLAIEDVVELSIYTGLPSVVKALVSEQIS
jgi:hypothetical protein